MFIGNLLFRHV